MATAYVAATNGTSADSVVDNFITTPTPSSVVGDVIFAWINTTNGTATAPTITAPADWSLIGTIVDGAAPQLRGSLYYKVVDGDDVANPTWTLSTGANTAWTMTAYRGLSPTTPFTNALVEAYAGSTAAKTTGTVTTTQAGWIVSGFGDRSGGTYSAYTDTLRTNVKNTAYVTPTSSFTQDSNGDVAAGSQVRTANGPAGTGVGSSFILRLNSGTGSGAAQATGTAYQASTVKSPIKEWLYDKGNLYIAHRGGSTSFVEMTADAYARCHALKIECIEMSVWRTSDGVYVLSHDRDTARMFGTSVDIPTNPYSALVGLTTTVGGHPMARLDDELAKYAGNKVIFIDNKSDTNNAAFLDYLDTFPNATGHFVLKGFYTNTMAALGRLRGYISWGYYYEVDLPQLDATHDKFDILSMEYHAPQAAFDAVLAKGKPTLAHVCLTLANVNEGFSKGARGVVSGKIETVFPNAPAATAAASGVAYDAVASGPANVSAGYASALGDAFNATTNVGTYASPEATEALSVGVAYDAIAGIVEFIPGAIAAEGVGQAFDATVVAEVPVAYFTTPTRRIYMSARPRHGLFSRMYLDLGLTVLKKDGFYTMVEDPDPADITAADIVYLGGRIYPILPTEVAALIAAGYGQWIVGSSG